MRPRLPRRRRGRWPRLWWGGARPEGEEGPHTGRRFLTTPPPNCPRLASRLALRTAAGLAATLAFAWGPALLYDEPGRGCFAEWDVPDGSWGYAIIKRSFGLTFIEATASSGSSSIPPRLEDAVHHELYLEPGFVLPRSVRMPELARELRGWPWRCLSADYACPSGRSAATVSGGLRLADGIRGTWGINYGRVLPLTPRWGGLLLDVALFTTGSFTLSTAFVALRQRRRRLRGLCTACGYPRPGPDGPCPECGAPTPK